MKGYSPQSPFGVPDRPTFRLRNDRLTIFFGSFHPPLLFSDEASKYNHLYAGADPGAVAPPKRLRFLYQKIMLRNFLHEKGIMAPRSPALDPPLRLSHLYLASSQYCSNSILPKFQLHLIFIFTSSHLNFTLSRENQKFATMRITLLSTLLIRC